MTEIGNETIRKIVIATGEVTTLAGTTGVRGYANGIGTAATFSDPRGITTDGTNLYVTDYNNRTIRKIVISTGVVTTLAGTVGTTGSADNETGTAATFNYPADLTTDGTNLYVTDTFSHTIRQIVISSGVVTTLAGTAESTGSTGATGTSASFFRPHGITTDGTNLYVADKRNGRIRQIVISTGVVTTLAGSNSTTNTLDHDTGTSAKFYYPSGITTDGTNLYITDFAHNVIRKVVISSTATSTLAGKAGTSSSYYGSDDGTGTNAEFYWHSGITTDGSSLYVVDYNNHTIRKIE